MYYSTQQIALNRHKVQIGAANQLDDWDGVFDPGLSRRSPTGYLILVGRLCPTRKLNAQFYKETLTTSV
jgi:hypothetical protein